MTDASGAVCFDAGYYPYGSEVDYTTTCNSSYKFTGYEYDSETGLDYAFARYYNSRLGRFMSPDPMGGHFMNPQSLNRYAYVQNNPLSMIDPTGMDCVYATLVNDHAGSVQVTKRCSKLGGINVNGTVDPKSFSITESANGQFSLSFGHTNATSGNFSLFQTGLAGPLDAGIESERYGIGSWNYARAALSQVYQNTRAVTNPVNIAGFYGASALAGVGGQLAAELGPQALRSLSELPELSQELVRTALANPQFMESISDFIQGYTPGPTPATWAGLAGLATGEVQSHWSQLSRGFQYSYRYVIESVPHQ